MDSTQIRDDAVAYVGMTGISIFILTIRQASMIIDQAALPEEFYRYAGPPGLSLVHLWCNDVFIDLL